MPPLLFFTDPERTPTPEREIGRLPRGAGVVFRGFGRPGARAQAAELRRLCARRGLVFMVGADTRLARAVKADGVHLPERLLKDQRRFVAGLLTAAAHSERAIRRARLAGVDAVVVSPVFPSESPSAARPLGTVRLAALVRRAGLPVIALGGVNARTARALTGTGVVGLAAIDGLRT